MIEEKLKKAEQDIKAAGVEVLVLKFLASNYPEELTQMIVNATPMRRTASVKDYVGIAVLLASDEGSFITGQTISVDDGVSMPKQAYN